MSASPELVFALIGAAVLAALLGVPAWQHARRSRWGAQPFPAAWQQLLAKDFALYRHLPAPLRQRLHAMVQVFVAEKPVIGCRGLHVSDEMRVLIAAQACVPVLALHGQSPAVHPYPGLRQVLLYPDAFRVKATHHAPGGVVTEGEEIRLGESWQEGIVVLAWPEVLAGARGGQWAQEPSLRKAAPADAPVDHPCDPPAAAEPAHNVVIHEFAHQLDQETGPANGSPLLRPGQSPQTWAQVFQRAYEDLQWLHDAGEPTAIDPYGITAPEEFFATAAEAFFMQPTALHRQHPELYGQLRQFFGLDPLTWLPPTVA